MSYPPPGPPPGPEWYDTEESKPLGFYTGTDGEPDAQWVEKDGQPAGAPGAYWTGTQWIEDPKLPAPRPAPALRAKVVFGLCWLLVLPFLLLRVSDVTVFLNLSHRDPLVDGVYSEESWELMSAFVSDQLVCQMMSETVVLVLSLVMLLTGSFTSLYQLHQVIFRCWGVLLGSAVDVLCCCGCCDGYPKQEAAALRARRVRAYVHEAAVGAWYLSTIFFLYKSIQVPFDIWRTRTQASYGYITYPMDAVPSVFASVCARMLAVVYEWVGYGIAGFFVLLMVQRRTGLLFMTALGSLVSVMMIFAVTSNAQTMYAGKGEVFPSTDVVTTHGFPRTPANRILYRKSAAEVESARIYQKHQPSLDLSLEGLEPRVGLARHEVPVRDGDGEQKGEVSGFVQTGTTRDEPEAPPAFSTRFTDGNKGTVTLDYNSLDEQWRLGWNWTGWAGRAHDEHGLATTFAAHLPARSGWGVLGAEQAWVVDEAPRPLWGGSPSRNVSEGEVAYGASATPRDFKRLRSCLEEMSDKVDVRLSQIYLLPSYSTSRHSNAFCAGGENSRIIGLYDSLFIGDPPTEEDSSVLDSKSTMAESPQEQSGRIVDNVMQEFFSKKTPDDGDVVRHRVDMVAMSDEGIIGVMAHELGHAKLGHTDPVNFAVPLVRSIVTTGAVLALLMHSATLGAVFGAAPAIGVALYGSFLYPAQGLLLNLWKNAASRRYETEADVFAAQKGYGKDLADALKTLAANSNQHPSYSRLYEILHFDHPTTRSRLANIQDATEPAHREVCSIVAGNPRGIGDAPPVKALEAATKAKPVRLNLDSAALRVAISHPLGPPEPSEPLLQREH